MTDFNTIAELAKAENRLWKARGEAELDRRVAERSGNGELEAAMAAEDAAQDAWFDNHRAVKAALAEFLKPYGLETADIRRIAA